MDDRRDLILNIVSDLVADFVYYDRKEDEDLPRGSIEDAIKSGEITIEDIANKFGLEMAKATK